MHSTSHNSAGPVSGLGQNLKQRAEILDETRWANEFSWPEIESLAYYLSMQRASRHDVICREGAADDTMFIIARGSVNILKEGSGGNKRILAALGQGQTLGEMSLLDGEPRSATAVAESDVVLLAMSKSALEDMIREKPGLAVKFIMKLARLLSQRLRKTSGALADHLR